jgi:hypothetical protein
MQYKIELKNTEEIISAFKDIPNGARVAVHYAIKDALDSGRTEMVRAIRDQYNVGYSMVLNAIKPTRVLGMTAELMVSSTRVPLYLFPHRDIYPYGVAIAERKDTEPINMLHAFTPAHTKDQKSKIFERESADFSRYPIRWIMGISITEMSMEREKIEPRVTKAIEDEYYRRIDHYLDEFTKGALIPGIRKSGTPFLTRGT